MQSVLAVATFLLLAAMTVPAWAQDKTDAKGKAEAAAAAPGPVMRTIKGRVLDQAGNPVAGAAVSRSWNQGRGADAIAPAV